MITNSTAQAASDIRDIKAPVEIPDAMAWFWWTLGALVVFVLASLVWRQLHKRMTRTVVAPPLPAHLRARQKLAEALDYLAQPKTFCTLVSDTARIYLEERFQFRAPERTTEEFLRELAGTNRLLPDQKESLGKFLESCDLVKFAKYEPGENELRGLHSSALRLVEETEPGESQKPEGGSQESEIRSQKSEVFQPVQRIEFARGNKLAIVGVLLQLGNSVFFFAYFVGLAKALKMVLNLPSQMTHPNPVDLKNLLDAPLKELNQLQEVWKGVLIASGIGVLIGIIGLVLIFISLTKQRYRAEWLFWFLVIYSLILCGAFPFGTIFGIFFLVYCLTKRHEFLNQ